ncbi:C2 calcium-dependent domain-containing protein 4C [Patella vulgata]|uniref:C2 calcium-dependent domain-containing protein 4C n=1 Tax=Patella vulgata TaxID=6465 RepID=UPI002180700B|nr:C2 calcium-dependent domain-containing protein 4C [Patella vulgata]
MESMKDIKEWLINKCKIPNINAPDGYGSDQGSSFCTVVTPRNIPEFVIPGSNESSRQPSVCSNEDDIVSQSSGASVVCFTPSPGVSPRGSFSCLEVPYNNKSPVHTRSAPVSPKHDTNNGIQAFSALSMVELGERETYGTNADPCSTAAVSLLHFRTRTNYGFTTLKESPHSRRRESLFMESTGQPKTNVKIKYPSCIDIGIEKCSLNNAQNNVYKKNPRREHSMDNKRMYDRRNTLSEKDCYRNSKRYYRRRSSAFTPEPEYNGDDSSSDTTSPGPQRRGHYLPTFETPVKRHSSPCCTPITQGPDIVRDFSNKSCSCSSISKPYTSRIAELGELKFSFQYFPHSKKLRVTMIKAENLYVHNKATHHLNIYAKLYLMPGKIQRQVSQFVKQTRNPHFNQEFHFDGFSIDELEAMRVRIKLFDKGQKLKLTEYIGEVNLNLSNYDLLQENRMWKDLETKRNCEDLGHLYVTLNYEPRGERLTVMVVEATGLPQHNITGPPDPYIRVEVIQTGRGVARKQTRTRKNTTHPVFKETFTFTISTRQEDLLYTTIKLTVFDYDRIRNDDVIGEVRIGYGSPEESGLEHWTRITRDLEREVSRWHYINDVSSSS